MKFEHLLLVLTALLALQQSLWSADDSQQPEKNIATVLKKLKEQCDNPKISNASEWLSYLSTTERIRIASMADLRSFGPTAVTMVRQELASAKGEYKDMLVVALAALRDEAAVTQAAGLMLKAQQPAVRVCAAFELRRLKNKNLIEPFKLALADSFKRQDGGCVRIGDGMIYPVRLIASDALVELGLPFDEVRKLRDKTNKPAG